MGRTPWELARSITSEQFTWLRAYQAVEPFGFEIENFRAGVVASMIARCYGNRQATPSHFYPQIGQPVNVDTQSQDEQMSILMAAGNRNGRSPS